MNDYSQGPSVWHVIWSGALTVATALLASIGALFKWNWRRLERQVDGKASQKELDALHDDVRQILENQRESDRVSREERHEVRNALQQLSVDVGMLKERAGFFTREP